MGLSIHDVAREASLSCETILEVLTSPSALEPEVVRFVMQTIRKSGYLDTFSRWKNRDERVNRHPDLGVRLSINYGNISGN